MNGIVVGLLPGVLWMVAVIFAVSIITITVSRGHLFTPKRRATAGRSGRLVDGENAFHVVCGGTDPVSRVDVYSGSDVARMLAFYDHAQLPGAIIIFALVLLELIAMYLQARNASETGNG